MLWVPYHPPIAPHGILLHGVSLRASEVCIYSSLQTHSPNTRSPAASVLYVSPDGAL